MTSDTQHLARIEAHLAAIRQWPALVIIWLVRFGIWYVLAWVFAQFWPSIRAWVLDWLISTTVDHGEKMSQLGDTGQTLVVLAVLFGGAVLLFALLGAALAVLKAIHEIYSGIVEWARSLPAVWRKDRRNG
jgi:hypothetical protein